MSVRWLNARFYADAAAWDPLRRFLAFMEPYLEPHHEVIDLGAGAGEHNAYQFKGRVRRIVGVDLDPRVRDNPLLDEGLIGDLMQVPVPDNSFDVAFSIYVLEHIADPARFTREVARILRPGGYFFALTPNRYHYVPMVASLTPTGFHKWFNARRGRPEEDTFPTFYRMNSRRALRRQFDEVGFDEVALQTLEVRPNYLTFSTPTFLLGTLYERLVNSTETLSSLRVGIMAAFRKRGAASNGHAAGLT